jgi:RNA-directed DNA polymerase
MDKLKAPGKPFDISKRAAWEAWEKVTCFPPPVRAVEIPKPHGGGTRIPGVPTEPANCPSPGVPGL